MNEFVKIKNYVYISAENGRSRLEGFCSNCNKKITIFRWKGVKKCDCGKLVIEKIE